MPDKNSTASFHIVLSGWFVLGLLLAVVLLFGTLSGYISPRTSLIWASVAFAMLFFFGRSKRPSIASLFQHETSEPLLEGMADNLRSFVVASTAGDHIDALTAYNMSVIHAYYGEFSEARMYIASIDWSNRPGEVAVMEFWALALLHYLDDENFQEGLSYARQAKAMIPVDDAAPNAFTITQDAYVKVGEVLTKQFDRDVLHVLEGYLDSLQIFPQILIWWALGCGYTQLQEEERAATFFALAKDTAPHCPTFHDIPSSWSLDSSS